MSFGSWRDHLAEEEVIEALRELDRLDTSNPLGNEEEAARVLCNISAKLELDAGMFPLGDYLGENLIRPLSKPVPPAPVSGLRYS